MNKSFLLRNFIRSQLLENSNENLANEFADRVDELWKLYDKGMSTRQFQEKLETLHDEARKAGIFKEMSLELNKRDMSVWDQEELHRTGDTVLKKDVYLNVKQ